MAWTNPPQSLTDARDALLLCPTVTASVLPSLTTPQRQARCHYPRSDARSDTMPLFLFQRQGYQADRLNAVGYRPSGGVLVWLLVNDANVDDGTLEQYAEGIVNDLVSLGSAGETGFQYITQAECGEAIEPTAAMLAGAVAGQPDTAGCSYRAISISWKWGD